MMRSQYILDSNICIHLLHNRPEVVEAIKKVEWKNCYITELGGKIGKRPTAILPL